LVPLTADVHPITQVGEVGMAAPMKFRHKIVPDFHIASNEPCLDTLGTGIPATAKAERRSAP
jgi:hypothetical protein